MFCFSPREKHFNKLFNRRQTPFNMVFVKLMGALDLITGITIILFHYDLIGLRLFLTFTLYLLLKGFMFKGDLASMVDFAVGAYMLLMLILPITILTYICAIYLFQKSISSLI